VPFYRRNWLEIAAPDHFSGFSKSISLSIGRQNGLAGVFYANGSQNGSVMLSYLKLSAVEIKGLAKAP
jgi:hypothetical protein